METSFGTRPGQLPAHELGRARAAARHAKRVHPGPIGELVAAELTAHAEFGYRFDADGLVGRLITEILGSATAPEDTPLARLLGPVPTGGGPGRP